MPAIAQLSLRKASAECGPVLVVEDPFVTRYLETLLEQHGYSTLPAGPSQAVRALRSWPDAASVILTNTPGLFLEFAERVSLVYIASAPDPDLAAQFERYRVVRKPFRPAELMEALEELTADMVC